jgi:hypothetical protein
MGSRGEKERRKKKNLREKEGKICVFYMRNISDYKNLKI